MITLRHYVLDNENRPIVCDDLIAWAQWCETASNRTVGLTDVTSEIRVSTVFLGMDHRFPGRPKGPPILFETLVFGGPLDGQGGRYVSWDDAEAGHKAMVRKVRAAIGQKIETEP